MAYNDSGATRAVVVKVQTERRDGTFSVCIKLRSLLNDLSNII